MRNPNRIETLLRFYSSAAVRESYLKNVVQISGKADITRFLNKWNEKSEQILAYWNENPNFRISQVLIGMKIIPPFSGTWMNTEDEAFLKLHGYASERQLTILTHIRDDGKEIGIPLDCTSNKHLNQIITEQGEDAPIFIGKEIEYRKGRKISVVEVGNSYYRVLDLEE